MTMPHPRHLSPRTPQAQKLPPGLGITRRGGGGAIDFHDAGIQGESLKPVDSTTCNLVSSVLTSYSNEFDGSEFPQVWLFLPQVAPFLPQADFSHCGPFFFISSSFKRREREKERGGTQSGQSTGLGTCNKAYPRVSTPIHGFSVDAFLSKTQCWRGFAGFQAPIHASTERNACIPPLEVPDGR